jgi:hypothetical protein
MAVNLGARVLDLVTLHADLNVLHGPGGAESSDRLLDEIVAEVLEGNDADKAAKVRALVYLQAKMTARSLHRLGAGARRAALSDFARDFR